MEFAIENSDIDVEQLCQKIGYEPESLARESGYIKLVGESNYPRFHLFVSQEKNKLKFALHLDQEQFSCKGDHDSEYESVAIQQEVKRIKEIIFSEAF